MRKFLIILLTFLVVVGLGAGGVYLFLTNSKSPTLVASRTLKNLQKADSASMEMKVDTDVRAEVGVLSFLGIKNPETSVSMDYDIDVFKDPALLHANVSISAFDIDALKDVEAVIAEEDGEMQKYFRWNDSWYRYVQPEDESAKAEEGASESGDADASAPAAAAAQKSAGALFKTASKNKSEDGAASDETINAVDFETILQGIEDGSLSVSMRDGKEVIDGKECFVYDIDMTGDMLEKVIRLSGEEKSLIPDLKADEHVTGSLYIDAKESLPASLVLSTGDILSEQIKIDAIHTSLSVTKIDIDVKVKEYNIDRTASVPDKYTDISDLKELSAGDWLDAALDISGIRGLLAGSVS